MANAHIIKIIQAIVKMMYPISPSIDENVPPNNPVTSFITSHNRGIAITSIINASRMQNNIFKILPIAIKQFISNRKYSYSCTPRSVQLSDGGDALAHYPGYKPHAVWHSRLSNLQV